MLVLRATLIKQSDDWGAAYDDRRQHGKAITGKKADHQPLQISDCGQEKFARKRHAWD